ncbi:MAG: hypothetical protein ABEH38_08140 [Flavobacteriales bacterium]
MSTRYFELGPVKGVRFWAGVLFLLTLGMPLTPQDPEGEEKEEEKRSASFFDTYNQWGLTPVLLSNPSREYPFSIEETYKKAMKEVSMHQRYDDNRISNFIYSCPPSDCKVPNDLRSSGRGFAKALSEMAEDTALKKEMEKDIEKYTREPGPNATPLKEQLRSSHIPKELMDTLFNADEDGRYNMDRIYNRVRRGLNDREVKRLKATMKGVEGSKKDIKWAARMLESNYLLVMRLQYARKRYKDHKVIYDQDSSEIDTIDPNNYSTSRDPDKDYDTTTIRKFDGYKVSLLAKIYRVDLNEQVRREFFSNCWAGRKSTDKELAEAKKARKKMTYPLETKREWRLTGGSGEAELKAGATKKELFYEANKEALQKLVKSIGWTGLDAMEVTKSLYDHKSHLMSFGYAKIGTKEGLQPDDRYDVYERVQENGEIKTKRVGELRATPKIAQNDTIATGNMPRSRFVQTWGGKLGKGMLMKENQSAGLGLVGGWVSHTQQFIYGGIDMRVGAWTGTIPGWYVYWGYGAAFPSFDNGKIRLEDQEGSKNSQLLIQSVDIATGKEFYLFRHFQFTPFGGMRLEFPEFREFSMEKEATASFSLEGGVQLGVNLSQFWRLTGHFAYTTASYDKHSRYGKKVSSGFAEKVPALEAGEENPYHLKKGKYRYGAALRLRF